MCVCVSGTWTVHIRGKGRGLSQGPAGTAGVHIGLKIQASQHGPELRECVKMNLLPKVMVTYLIRTVPMKQPQRETCKLVDFPKPMNDEHFLFTNRKNFFVYECVCVCVCVLRACVNE